MLLRNEAIEQLILPKMKHCNKCLANAKVEYFLRLSVVQLQDYVHARMFNGKLFQKTQIAGPDGKLNKTCYKDQAAEDIGRNCNKSNSYLVRMVRVVTL